jgi:hypothetical protein
MTRGANAPQIAILSALCPQLNLLNLPRKNSWRNPPPLEKIPGYASEWEGHAVNVGGQGIVP